MRTEGLPVYYARDWFISTLYRLGSLAAMEAKFGYSNQVLSKWGAPRLGPSVRGGVKALRAAGWNSAQIAAELRISRTTATRLAREV